jgi:hypothetical protein
MSPNTSGDESMVTVTFEKQEEGTVMTLVHSDLPILTVEEGTRTAGTTS